MRKTKFRGSLTIEAAVYIPFIVCMLFYSMEISIEHWNESREKVPCEALQNLNSVEEFYMYQVSEEIGKELEGDES